ncbi:zinc transporter ZupT [Propioniciclava soli]|uniref:Zinc transporter ZupT n=1 Tax=Propioniciclava soli TaxID=2775081 RepID=A0ABZ3C516_9ACTN
MVLALAVALLAGLATSIGGALALGRRTLRRSWLAVMLAFAAGAMLIVSFVQAIPLGLTALQASFGESAAHLLLWASFFTGIGLVLAVDRLLPVQLNPNETAGGDVSSTGDQLRTGRLLRSGLLVAGVLALHNLPEGMATFVATYADPGVGLPLAVAIAIHNVPEGIAVAAPVYAATGSRTQAFWWATASGLTEPLGALLAASLLAWVVPPVFFGVVYGLVAGMMVFLALDELLPGAWRYQTDKHQTVYGMLAGMAVVVASIVLFTL